MATDDWVEAAMNDDTLVADFLVRLKSRSQPALLPNTDVICSFNWGRRQPRTKILSSATARFLKKNGTGDCARDSPTTPLSWSGGSGSSSASGDGSEESGQFNGRCLSSSRSKAAAAALNNSNTTATTSKKTKRKQTLALLREHESILLEQSVHLKKEIATMQTSYVEQRTENDNLKRIKLDLGLQSSLTGSITTTGRPKDTLLAATTSTSPSPVEGSNPLASESCQPSKEESSQQNRRFLLPDLNMIPTEEDSDTETTLYGTS